MYANINMVALFVYDYTHESHLLPGNSSNMIEIGLPFLGCGEIFQKYLIVIFRVQIVMSWAQVTPFNMIPLLLLYYFLSGVK